MFSFSKWLQKVPIREEYTSLRKTYEWTIKVTIHFIEEAVLNAFILYNKQFPGKMPFMNYKMEVIEKSLQRASATDETNIDLKIGRYFLQLIPPTETKSNPQKRCVVCLQHGRRKESRYQCKHCPSHHGF